MENTENKFYEVKIKLSPLVYETLQTIPEMFRNSFINIAIIEAIGNDFYKKVTLSNIVEEKKMEELQEVTPKQKQNTAETNKKVTVWEDF